MRYRGLVASVITLVGVSGTIGVVAWGMQTGPMRIDQQAVDLFNQQVDQPVVNYWGDVCTTVRDVRRAVDDVNTAAEDAVGLDEADTPAFWRDTAAQYAAHLAGVSGEVTRINDAAPTAVVRPDGDTDNTNWHGHLDELQGVIDNGKARASGMAEANDEEAGDLPETLRVASGELWQHTSAALGRLTEQAPIYGQATSDKVAALEQCGELLGNTLGDDTVVDQVVDTYVSTKNAHDDFQAALGQASTGLSEQFTDYTTYRQALLEALHTVGESAGRGVGLLDITAETPDGDEAYRDAAGKAEPYRHRVMDVYRDIYQWATQATDDLGGIGDGDLATFGDSMVASLRGLQVVEAKAVTAVLMSMPVPNSATAEAISARVDGGDGPAPSVEAVRPTGETPAPTSDETEAR